MSRVSDLARMLDVHTHIYWRDELTVTSPLIDRSSDGDWAANGARPADARALWWVERRLAEQPF